MGSEAGSGADKLRKLEKVSLDTLIEAIERSWGAKTSFDPQNWWPSNAAYKQSAVTALVVNDFFGGNILRTIATYQNGSRVSHYYNELPDKNIVDLTRIQFPEGTKFSDPEDKSRGHIMLNPLTAERYNILKERVELRLENSGKERARLYFAHPAADRKELREREIDMECRLGIELLNPFYDVKCSDIIELDPGIRKPCQGINDPNKIVMRDLEAIKSCEGLLAVIPKDRPMVGASMEIFYNSFVLGRDTYLIIEDEGLFGHPWLVKNSVARFKNADEFMGWWEEKVHKSYVEMQNR